MPFFVLSLLLQVALVVHIVKTGRNTTWIWIVVILPGAGSIAYILLEVLPELMGSRTARSAMRSVEQIINPNKDINIAERDYSITATVENTLNLANECFKKGMFQESKNKKKKALSGLHEHDPDIMFSLAKVEFSLEDFEKTKKILESLIEHNPEFKNQEAHLLFARSVQMLGETEKALEEYEVLAGYYSGAEAKYRYAVLLRQLGEVEKAKTLLVNIIQNSNKFGKHYWSMNREWITLAKKELSS